MVDLSMQLSNAAISFGNIATKCTQEAEEYRRIQQWRESVGDKWSYGDEAQAQQLELDAKIWRERETLARQGLLLHDPSNPNWTLGEFKDLITEACKQHRIRFVDYRALGAKRLQNVPFEAGTTPQPSA
jgi:hypothetical protein